MRALPSRAFIPLLGLAILASCAAPVEITVPAKEPLTGFRTLKIAAPQNDVIGQIDAGVVNDIMQDAVEGILDLKHFNTVIVSDSIALKQELSDRVSRSDASGDSVASVAVITTTIVEYDEGSGFLRFLFGAMAGSGKVTLELSVANESTHQLIMKARTESKISGSLASASNVVGPLSKAIVNFVEDNFVEPNR